MVPVLDVDALIGDPQTRIIDVIFTATYQLNKPTE